MKFMTIVKGPEADMSTVPPALFEAIDKLGAEASSKGVMVSMGGLMPTAAGARSKISKGRIVVTDGPFTETKEIIGGFAIYEVASKAEAMEWTRRFLQLHIDNWPGWEGEVEV